MNVFKSFGLLSFVILFASLQSLSAQDYISYFTGSTDDVSPDVTFGICLMGGSTENDEAMIRLMQSAGGGDVVVLRVTGEDGYNNYLYTELGVTLNSVETLVIPSVQAAQDPYVEQQIRNAEAIWIAGGNQWDYISFWKNTPVHEALNDHLNEKQAPIGGTSAGMAIMGSSYFSAENGTVFSDEALLNPYNTYMTFGHDDFIEAPFLQYVITDTHYDNPERKGRHFAFLARMTQDLGIRSYGIAADEYTAVYVDNEGIASVYGEADYEDYAYFLQANCIEPIEPETCTAGEPLTWNRNQDAVRVYVIKGEEGGEKYLDLTDWQTGSGGDWERWYADNGDLFFAASEAPDCPTAVQDTKAFGLEISPNPASDYLHIALPGGLNNCTVSIFGTDGKCYLRLKNTASEHINISSLPQGLYLLHINCNGELYVQKLSVVR